MFSGTINENTEARYGILRVIKGQGKVTAVKIGKTVLWGLAVLAFCGSVLGNTALEFDGVDDYVTLSENAVTTTDFTISAWANKYGQGGGGRQL